MSTNSSIMKIQPLGFPWATIDPFLFCVYHDDAYPRGNAQFGPDAVLAGRDLGQDFAGKDGWRMYHGLRVPGFPSHPHRGFETVTIVRKGLIDHSDSLGATARFGGGDVQWLTAGKGIVHSEMFPLLNQSAPNPLELFQIWLNLPAKNKMVPPHFTMFWSTKIPRRVDVDAHGKATEVCCVAGRLGDAGGRAPDSLAPLPPPPDSWASQPDADVAIWTLKMAPGARWTLPAAATSSARRQLYFFKGVSVAIAGQDVAEHAAIELAAAHTVELVNGPDASEFLLLQGKPIAEPVAQYGPFVMNTQAEIHQAFADYRATEFGGWPWPDNAPVHGAANARFAKHADGRLEALPE
jgi:quercetin 2,3-dioxygenase